MSGFIKIDRKILEWEWWSDKNTSRLFLYMILKANWKDANFRGINIPKGSFVSSLEKLAESTNLTIGEARIAINHLKKTGEITSNAHGKFTVFTINKYSFYQEDNNETANRIQDENRINTSEITSRQQQNDKQNTNRMQTEYKQSATIEEKKEEKEGKKEKNTLCATETNTLFERLWSIYPVKKGKGQVSLAARQRLLKVGYEEMVRAIDRYLLELEKDSDWRKPQNGSTFFNSGYLDYLDKNYVPDKKPKQKITNMFQNFPQNNYDFAELERELLSN